MHDCMLVSIVSDPWVWAQGGRGGFGCGMDSCVVVYGVDYTYVCVYARVSVCMHACMHARICLFRPVDFNTGRARRLRLWHGQLSCRWRRGLYICLCICTCTCVCACMHACSYLSFPTRGFGHRDLAVARTVEESSSAAWAIYIYLLIYIYIFPSIYLHIYRVNPNSCDFITGSARP